MVGPRRRLGAVGDAGASSCRQPSWSPACLSGRGAPLCTAQQGKGEQDSEATAHHTRPPDHAGLSAALQSPGGGGDKKAKAKVLVGIGGHTY